LPALSDILLQDKFTLWDPKQIIKKGRERQIFLFEDCVVFAKEVTEAGKTKYIYKTRLLVSNCPSLYKFTFWFKERGGRGGFSLLKCKKINKSSLSSFKGYNNQQIFCFPKTKIAVIEFIE